MKSNELRKFDMEEKMICLSRGANPGIIIEPSNCQLFCQPGSA